MNSFMVVPLLLFLYQKKLRVFILYDIFVHSFNEADLNRASISDIVLNLDKKYSKANFREKLEGVKKFFK